MVALLVGAIACSDETTTPRDSAVPDRPRPDAAPPTCHTKAFLPGAGAVSDFALKGAVAAASNAKELQALIDGGSEKYEKNKFACMVKATYASATKTHAIEVWVFDQTDAAGAEAAYKASQHPDDADITPAIGDASRENVKLLFEYTADMRLGKYLVRVKIDDKQAKTDGPLMLKAVEKLIKGT